MLTVYFDDSGNDGRSPMFLLSGYASTEERWTQFTEDWQRELDFEPRIEAFHMSQAWSKKEGSWARMDDAERDRRVARFATIPGKHGLTSLQFGVPFGYLASMPKVPSKRPTDDPHLFTLLLTMHGVADLFRQDMSLVFDRPSTPKLKNRLLGMMAAIMLYARSAPGYEALKHIKTCTFGDDEAVLPLQAADLLAWQWNRQLNALRDPKSIGRWTPDALTILNLGSRTVGKVLIPPQLIENFKAAFPAVDVAAFRDAPGAAGPSATSPGT